MALLCRANDPPYLFVHIYRTGGNAVRRALLRNGLPHEEIGKGHCTAADARALIADDGLWQAAVKFSFVRNPFDWMLSIYSYARRFTNHALYESCNKLQFNEWVVWYFQTWLLRPEARQYKLGDNRYTSQWNMLSDDGEQIVDAWGRTRSLQIDFDYICSTIGRPAEPLEWFNSCQGINREKDWRTHYNEEGMAVVREWWYSDFRMFGFASR